MMKDDTVYVGHMLDAARDAVARLANVDRSAFDLDSNLRLALTYLIQTIGEAARRVSDQFRADHPEVPWTIIVGMRHKIVHDYIHVDYETVWETATKDLPIVITLLEPIVCQD